MKAVVLAAGKGTRMNEITDTKPKPMVQVGDRPLLWHVLTALRGAGVTQAAVIVGYMGDTIRSYFGDGAEVGVDLSYFVQEVQDGTGRAADSAREFLSGGPFFFTFGDILAPQATYTEMAARYNGTPCDLILAVRWVDDTSRWGAVCLEDDRINEIVEKPEPGTCDTNWVNAGILIAGPSLFEYTARLEPSPRGEYEITDAMKAMINAGLDVRAFQVRGYWRDVGTPEDLDAAQKDACDPGGFIDS